MGSDQENKAGVEEPPIFTVVSDAEHWLLYELSRYRVGLWLCPKVLGVWYTLHGAIGTPKINCNKLHSQ